jgi:hypothetical protein
VRKTTLLHALLHATFVLALLPCASCATAPNIPFDTPTDAAEDASLSGAFSSVGDAPGATAEGGATPFVAPPGYDAASPLVPPPADGADASVPPAVDAAPPLPFDAGDAGLCATPLGPGDLVIDELMIASVAGTGDHGEWLEVRSTRDCVLDVIGLHGECPTGAKVVTFDILDDLWVPPGGTFLVADSSNPALEHDLPGALVTWSGEPGDVLRNKGTTLTLTSNGAMVDALTYPALKLTIGASYAFPADCAPSTRSDFTRWQISAASWFPGFSGTPNAPNADVHCPR